MIRRRPVGLLPALGALVERLHFAALGTLVAVALLLRLYQRYHRIA